MKSVFVLSQTVCADGGSRDILTIVSEEEREAVGFHLGPLKSDSESSERPYSGPFQLFNDIIAL
jgi:hypothetical protein